ncbi:MAG: hypothetical protein LKE61_03910 [Erysipelotrichaceae bacterium]|jgi:uncharacterized protein (UPF0218 family)|nr:hypothetical protein [Erysipelotrichaceae bacterium]MCH4045004.1 hypothetical protein [Erysipelotrichaceae bacterium]MCH4122216.1 hypothetical protein [Erysipelotrichaceae bacterium]MCI1362424.1 hypothetical protein [Solobacterium sp.]MCI1462278.1 hypothetical protein [Solobacterium sp.]
MVMKKSNYKHFRSDEITDHQLSEIERVLNSNPSLLDETGRTTYSQIIRTAIHHYYAEVTNNDSQDVYVQLIRDQLSQVLQPMTKAIVDSLTAEIRKSKDQNNHDINVYGEENLTALKILLSAVRGGPDTYDEAMKYCLEESLYDKVIRDVADHNLKEKEK